MNFNELRHLTGVLVLRNDKYLCLQIYFSKTTLKRGIVCLPERKTKTLIMMKKTFILDIEIFENFFWESLVLRYTNPLALVTWISLRFFFLKIQSIFALSRQIKSLFVFGMEKKSKMCANTLFFLSLRKGIKFATTIEKQLRADYHKLVERC